MFENTHDTLIFNNTLFSTNLHKIEQNCIFYKTPKKHLPNAIPNILPSASYATIQKNTPFFQQITYSFAAFKRPKIAS